MTVKDVGVSNRMQRVVGAQASRAVATSKSAVRHCRPTSSRRYRREAHAAGPAVSSTTMRSRTSGCSGGRHSATLDGSDESLFMKAEAGLGEVRISGVAETCQRGDPGAAGVDVGGVKHGVASGKHTDKGRKGVESL